MKKNVFVYMAVLLMTAIPVQSSASVVYSIEAYLTSDGSFSGAFTYTSPDFITANMLVNTSDLDACVVTVPVGDSCFGQEFYVDTTSLRTPEVGDYSDAIAFGFGEANAPAYFIGSHYYYYFENGAFGAVGIYDTVSFGIYQQARLTVSLSSVPLPASLWLLGSGLIVLARFNRRVHRNINQD